jgi:hypothetical protein
LIRKRRSSSLIFSTKNIAVVSCVAKNKDEEFKDNEKFIQGLEKLALAMQGNVITANFVGEEYAYRTTGSKHVSRMKPYIHNYRRC